MQASPLGMCERTRHVQAAALRQPAAGRRRFPAPGVAAALLLAAAGCASLEPVRSRAWRIEPVLDIQHSVAAAHGHYALGRYHDGMRAWDQAVAAYRQAIAADPRYAEAHNALGVALAQLGRHDDAELALRRAIAIEPQRAHLRSNLGFVMLLAGRPREAMVELDAAVQLDPDDPTARSNLREAAARWQALPADESRAVAAETGPPAALPATTATSTAAPAGAAPDPAIGAAPDGAHIISVAVPITVVDVPAPLPQTPAPHTVRVFDQPTVPAWPRAVAPALDMAQAPAAAPPVAVDLGAAGAGRASLRLELSNGNGVPGMAARLGHWLARQGVPASRLSNQRPFVQRQTVVEYRRGQEEAAWRVAQALPLATQVGPALRPGLKVDVRVVLGGDWRTSAACMEHNACPPATTVIATHVP